MIRVLCKLFGHTVRHPIRIIDDVAVTYFSDHGVEYRVLKDHYLCSRCSQIIEPSTHGPVLLQMGGLPDAKV